MLTTTRGAAMYIGALLGPGLLLLPGLAAAEAGPASLIAWAALLVLSALFARVFSALGRRYPAAGGVTGYVTAGLGSRAGSAAKWCFLAGVVTGAPLVCLIGASYVTALTGGGQVIRAAVAGLILLMVLALATAGLRASSSAQLLLVGLLVVVVVTAAAGSAGSERAANWVPFAPHGWLSVGHAATTLMFSFIGWEAVAPLTARFADPDRQLPRVIGITFAVTTLLYLGLAVATIGVLGPGAATLVPLAGLLRAALGPAGAVGGAVAAVVLTLGTTNAYVTGGAAMAGTRGATWFRMAIAASGAVLIPLYGMGLFSPASLVSLSTAMFLAVYLGCMASACVLLRGTARLAAIPAAIAVIILLAYCGPAAAGPAAVTLLALAPVALAPVVRISSGGSARRLTGWRDDVGEDGNSGSRRAAAAAAGPADQRRAVSSCGTLPRAARADRINRPALRAAASRSYLPASQSYRSE